MFSWSESVFHKSTNNCTPMSFIKTKMAVSEHKHNYTGTNYVSLSARYSNFKKEKRTKSKCAVIELELRSFVDFHFCR